MYDMHSRLQHNLYPTGCLNKNICLNNRNYPRLDCSDLFGLENKQNPKSNLNGTRIKGFIIQTNDFIRRSNTREVLLCMRFNSFCICSEKQEQINLLNGFSRIYQFISRQDQLHLGRSPSISMLLLILHRSCLNYCQAQPSLIQLQLSWLG